MKPKQIQVTSANEIMQEIADAAANPPPLHEQVMSHLTMVRHHIKVIKQSRAKGVFEWGGYAERELEQAIELFEEYVNQNQKGNEQ